jgi:hypothetical protein
VEESFQIKMLRAGYVEQKMREGKTYDQAMEMFDKLRSKMKKLSGQVTGVCVNRD